MKDDVIHIMEDTKQRRLKKERHDLVIDRLRLLSAFLTSFHTSSLDNRRKPNSLKFFDFASLPQFEEIITRPNEEHVSTETFQPLLSALPSLIEQWHVNVQKQMRNIIQPHSQPSTSTEGDPLNLASSMFRCHACAVPRYYPDIVSHRCAVHLPSKNVSAYYKDLLTYHGMSPFTPAAYLRLDERTKRELQTVIQLCGEDPATVTRQQMDSSDKRITCKACNSTGMLDVMTYGSAVGYFISTTSIF